MSSTDVHAHATTTPMPRVALGVVAAVIVAIAVNTGVAAIDRSLDHDSLSTGLTLISYGPLTAIGVLVGTTGWAAVRRAVSRPRAVLRVLVPVVVVLSFTPDLVLLATGTSPVNVVGLMIMHLIVAITTVTMLRVVLPLRDRNV